MGLLCNGTVHTSYNLNETRVAHARATRVTHAYFLSCTRNYTQCKLPSCIGLHASSLLFYTQGSFLHAHVYACARVNTVNGQENLKPTIKYNALIHVYGCLLEYTVVQIIPLALCNKMSSCWCNVLQLLV